RLVLLTPRQQIARNVHYCSAICIHRRLYEANDEIVLSAEPVSVRGGRLTWRNVFTARTRDLDDVGVFVWSTPRVADDAVAKQLFEAGLELRTIGDCTAPRQRL